MTIKHIIDVLENHAPPYYQESYDNTGLIIGESANNCTGVLCCLDITKEILEEAKSTHCNLIVAHHPILFTGIKSITGKSYVEQIIIAAIKLDIALYAIHTNLDNVLHGVNETIAAKLGLINKQILLPKTNTLSKLVTYVPVHKTEQVLNALFEAGAGNIGAYSEASFSSVGVGSFKGSENSNPTIGSKGVREQVEEKRVEVLIPNYWQEKIVSALLQAHPYEEVAYDIIPLSNVNQSIGSGLIGHLAKPMQAADFLGFLKESLQLPLIKHTAFTGQHIKKVAICGGSGSFLIPSAKKAGADIFITADIRYHAFFDAEKELVIADIGHWESEQYVPEQLFAVLTANFPNFAVLKTTVNTNPVRYYLG
jgi:dinuclear metal center YbgI/SA1388 family protein